MSISDWHSHEAQDSSRAKVRGVRSLLLCGLILAAMLAGAQQPASAASVCGWFATLGNSGACFPTPMEACKAAHAYYNPTKTFLGYKDTDTWDAKTCAWTIGGALPPPVGFQCYSGARKPPGRCIDDGDNDQQRDECSNGTVSPRTGYPIEILSGSKIYEAEDFRSADGSLVLARKYRSLPFGAAGIVRRVPRSIANWQLDFNHELHIDWYFDVFPNVDLHAANGASYGFARQSNGVMVPRTSTTFPNPQTDYTLEFVGTWPSSLANVLTQVTQWKVKDPQDRVWLFESYYDPTQIARHYGIARPKKVTFRGGLEWTFTYGTSTQLTTITDSFGKSITFDWIISNSFPLAISQANLPDGSKVKYIYEAINSAITTLPQPDRLIRVEKVNSAGAVIDSTTYHYENTSLLTHVTGVSDGALNRLWTVTYDSKGRATQSTRPNGVDSVSVAYGPVATTMTRTVTNALGKQTVYKFARSSSSTVYDARLAAVDGTASANCLASTRSISYSSAKFISSTTDEEGRVTNYTRDTRGRPTQIVDGVGTPSARTRTITWHATFDVPTQIVEPGLTTDLTWNTAGQLTQVTETDTTTHSVPYSTNGQTRTWAYTYSTTGGYLATVDGPLSGTGDTVTYAYNANGYLQSVTNEVGHVTEFTAWNGRGQPTSMTDANGVASTLTYDDIGRFKSQTVDPGGIAAMTSDRLRQRGAREQDHAAERRLP